MGADTPAPAPSGPETPWERYMQQEWPMDRDRFNALVAAEVARATAEWKARAEKAEAALRGAVGCMPTGVTQAHEERRPVRWFVENTSGMWLHKNGEEHTRTPIEAMSFRTREDAEREIERLSMASARPHATRSFYRATSHLFLEDADVMMSRASVTQAHEEAGAASFRRFMEEKARKSDQEMLDRMFQDAPIVHARKTQEQDEIAATGKPPYVSLHAWGGPMPKTQEPSSAGGVHDAAPSGASVGGSATTKEPPSAVGNTLPRAEPDGGGGSATLRLACELRGLQRNEYVDSADRVVAALRPWLAFVEAEARLVLLASDPDEDGYDAAWERREATARALLAATKKEGK